MNNDLISRSALMEALENDRMVFKSTITVPEALLAQGKHWRRCLEAAPAVDAVPVVLCAECEYYENEECVNPYIFTSDGAHLYTKPQDFCSYGERRDDE